MDMETEYDWWFEHLTQEQRAYVRAYYKRTALKLNIEEIIKAAYKSFQKYSWETLFADFPKGN